MARGARCGFSSQAIMCVQLFSWCVAACLLLYRGVTTLRKDVPVPVPSSVPAATTQAPNASEPLEPPFDLFEDATPEEDPDPTSENSAGDLDLATALHASHMGIPQSPPSQPAVRRVFRAQPGLRPASLILIVLGFSMLLVGPVVIILRKCDSTLQHRRAVKVSTDEEAGDPPPSYEEATAGTGAPRYSTLFEVLDSGELVCLNTPIDTGDDGCSGNGVRDCGDGRDEKAVAASGPWDRAVSANRDR